MADKYIKRDSSTGRQAEVEGLIASAGAGDAGKIPATDSSGRLDSSFMPVGVVADTFTSTASGALSAGDAAYVTSGGLIARASAAVSGNQADGFVLVASAGSAPATIYFEGRNTAVTGLTVGSRYYLDATTPGAITATPVTGTGKLHQYVGKAIATTSLTWEPDDATLLA